MLLSTKILGTGPFLSGIPNCKSKKDGKDHETIQSGTIPDPGYHMRK